MFRNSSSSTSTSMPVLKHIKQVFQSEFGHDFSKLPNRDNTLFVIIQHGFISIRPMMEAFLELGIHSDQVFMTTKPHTTPTYPDPISPAERHPDDMLSYFKTNFKHYVPFQWTTVATTPTQPDAQETVKKSRYKVLTDATHDKLFEEFCNYLIRYPDLPNRRIENIIICDEGGKFLSKFIERYHRPSSTARRNLNDYHVVAIEHTKCGTYRPELNNLPFPLINMADSYLKTHIESQFIAESMFVHLNAILQRLVNSSSMIIGVVGGGNIGKEVLVFLLENYAHIPVIIFDSKSDVLSSSEITALGWENVRRKETIEGFLQQATIILGCTGKDFMAGLSTNCFARNQANHIHLVSCSSGDTEFNNLLQQMPDYKFESLKDIRDYTMPLDADGERLITLYNGGFPMNFLIEQPAGVPVEETVPLQQVQITRSMKLVAIVQALKLLEVTAYFPKKYDNSLKDYMKLEVIYQWEIIRAFYDDLMIENPHTQLQIADGSMGVHQPTMNSVLNIPYYITTQHQVEMQRQLLRQEASIKILVIHGTTGSGKTTLAQHYLQKQRMQYPEHLSCTILAETALQWRDQLKQWAEELFPELKSLLIAEKNPQRQESMIDRRLQTILCEKEWCIVIDNWDQEQLLFKRIEDLLLSSNVGKGILLITTQGEPPYADTDRSLDLSFGLTQEESQKLLIKVMNLEKTNGITWEQLGTEAELASLTEYLNRLPLALVVAGSYLLWENKSLPRNSQTPFTYSNYKNLLKLQVTELIRIHKEKLGKKGDIPREDRAEFIRVKTQEAAVDLSLKKAIQPDSANPNMNLWQMLCFCGFIASDGIPQQLLKDYLKQILPEDEREIYETFFDMLLQEAQKYSLLQFENRLSAVDSLNSLHMHRVIQKVLRDVYWEVLPNYLKSCSTEEVKENMSTVLNNSIATTKGLKSCVIHSFYFRMSAAKPEKLPQRMRDVHGILTAIAMKKSPNIRNSPGFQRFQAKQALATIASRALNEQDYEKAISTYEELISLYPNDAGCHHNCACAYHLFALQQGIVEYFNKAQHSFEESLRLEKRISTQVEYANFLRERGCYTEAIRLMNEVLDQPINSSSGLSYGAEDVLTLPSALSEKIKIDGAITIKHPQFFAYYLKIECLVAAQALTDEIETCLVKFTNSLMNFYQTNSEVPIYNWLLVATNELVTKQQNITAAIAEIDEPSDDWSQNCHTLFAQGYRFSLEKHSSSLKITRIDQHDANEPIDRFFENVRVSCAFFMTTNLGLNLVDSTERNVVFDGTPETLEMAHTIFAEIANDARKARSQSINDTVDFCRIS